MGSTQQSVDQISMPTKIAKNLVYLLLLSCLTMSSFAQPVKQTHLPNGWSLSPAGRSLPLGDLPLNTALSPNGQLLAVTNNGQSKQSIQLFDTRKEKLLDEQPIGKSWYGLGFSNDGKFLYASGGNDNRILIYSVNKDKLKKTDSLVLGAPWPKQKIGPTGIDVNNKANRLYTVTKEDSALYIMNIQKRETVKRIPLHSEAYACLLSPDKSKLYISLWGAQKVLVLDTRSENIIAEIAVGSHPNELLTTRNGNYLFVANANDNSVSVIRTSDNKVVETIIASLFPSSDLTGSTTNGLALSDDDKTLYIANADNNCLAVMDVSRPGSSSSLGFIPTGWYPTNLKVVKNKIFVANGKGFTSMANPFGPQPIKRTDNSGVHKGVTGQQEVQYIGGLFKGTLSIINRPDGNTLKQYSKQVFANTPFRVEQETHAKGLEGNPIPMEVGQPSPIKHVFYVIKENRTYDQVLGDMPEGNGDYSLTIFPEKITPNHHALARQFVLLDNFYVDAEVSADGHNWSTAAYANDYVEKTWPTSYGGRGGTYDYEGSRKIAYPKKGFIWDYCQRAGVSYRSYGEFGEYGKSYLPSLQGHMSERYPGYDLEIKDINRIQEFKADFDSLLAIGKVPQFNSIRIGNDHTYGQRLGKKTPLSMVADNDWALGQLVEFISHSPIWKESAIFVLEDDAQNGPDHVDAHRSPAFVISPYIKMGTVNSSMYSTSGMLRTIELILGLPPMSQYDAAAMPMFGCFTHEPNLKPYVARAPNVSLDDINVDNNVSAKRSAAWNFSREDAAPDIDLNEVVWKSVKGEESVMPAPKRSAFVIMEKKAETEGDDD